MLYEIRPSPLKGQGIFTTHHIPQGTTIISEPPLLYATKKGSNFLTKYHALSPQSQQKFLSLHNKFNDSHPANRPPISHEEGIWITNRFSISRNYSAVFEHICKANHSCHPNARWVWRPTGRMEVVAARDLEKGEEVLVSYVCFRDEGVVERRGKLAVWGFVCRCERCVDEAGF